MGRVEASRTGGSRRTTPGCRCYKVSDDLVEYRHVVKTEIVCGPSVVASVALMLLAVGGRLGGMLTRGWIDTRVPSSEDTAGVIRILARATKVVLT